MQNEHSNLYFFVRNQARVTVKDENEARKLADKFFTGMHLKYDIFINITGIAGNMLTELFIC